jgi:putative ABC transport system substrate-binding protein
MDRRTFIRGSAASALTAAITARGQAVANPTIGFLCGETPARWARLVAAFRRGLANSGYDEGKNVGIEFRWAEGRDERLPGLAAELVRRNVALIVATGGPNPVLAAKAATTTIPIVFTLGADPVRLGLVASLSRPAGNITGVGFNTAQLNEKRLQLLHELVPKATTIAALMAPDNPVAEFFIRQSQDTARALGLQIQVSKAQNEQEIDAAFAAIARLRVGAVLVGPDSFFYDRRDQLAELTKRYALPACFDLREFVEAGGLISYGANLADVYAEAGTYAGRILSGAKPTDLPVLQSTTFDLVVNAKTANALGLTIPQTIRSLAQVI